MSAILSDDGLYRYWLQRSVARTGPVYAFFGVNPSTADAEKDDATVRKWSGFVQRWGGSGYVVGNAFAYRATDVRTLAGLADPVGPLNDEYLDAVIADANFLVPCWGMETKVPQALRWRFSHVLEKLKASGKPVLAFGIRRRGLLHPLMLPYSTPLVSLV